ncbi:MAG TPA: hypothetical protein DCO71_05615 [Gammaproteobacteria bacterium]|nr:hypothetical protein [Gammaproteobacteria bacterium]
MIERTMMLAGAFFLLALLLAALKRNQLKSSQSMATATITNAKPNIVYFWSPQCSQCIAIQTPIIDTLAAIAGEDTLTVSKHDVSKSLEHANNWGVKTVPTIFVLDKNGTVRYVNNGLATKKILMGQLEELSD